MVKKFLALIISLLAVTAIFPAAGCAAKTGGFSEKLMTDFESVAEIMSVKVTAYESSLSLNADKRYVTSGNSSLKMNFNKRMNAVGYYEDNIVQFIPQQQYFAITDFKNVVGFAADIWNENDYETETCLSFNNRTTVIGYSTLKKGYNAVSFYFDNQSVFAFTETELKSVDLSFYSGRGNDVLFMDNVRLIVSDAPYVPFDYQANFRTDVNYSFDNAAELYAIIDLGGYDSIFSRARLSLNRDKRYIKLGEGSMKVDFLTSVKTGKADNYRIRTFDKMTGDFNAYAGKNYALKADVYNPNDKDITVDFRVFSTLDDETFATTVNVKANGWSGEELMLKIDDIQNAFSNVKVNVLTVVFGFYGIEGGDTVYIDNLRFEGVS